MNFIVSFLSHILGFLMDFFFRGLTLIGYPRMWACIVLFAFATRLIFLSKKISDCKSSLLASVVRKELLAADPNFYEKTKNKELTVKRAALKKQVYKKYKLSNSSSCLTLLIQYPILVALFGVVNNPQKYVPSLETIAGTNPQVNSFLGLSLSDIPLNNFSFNDFTSYLIMLVPLIIIVSNVIKFVPTIKALQTPSQKRVGYFLYFFFIVLLGWCSAKLPVVISLYWLANDVANSVLDFFIRKSLSKNKTIVDILAQHEQKVKENEIKGTAEDKLIGEKQDVSYMNNSSDAYLGAKNNPSNAYIGAEQAEIEPESVYDTLNSLNVTEEAKSEA